MQHSVHVLEDNDHYVVARDCHLKVTGKDTIKWINRTDTDFTIHFEDSPFDGNDFIVPKKSEACSPDLKSDVVGKIVDKKIYSYEILPPAVSSAKAADPNVIVHNP
jgi:hypothetical protein